MNKKEIINIAIAVNEKFVRYACVMLTSIFENHKDKDVHIYILYGEVKDDLLNYFYDFENKYDCKIHTIKIPRNLFPETLPHNEEWPMEVYYRLALVDVLPKEIERILCRKKTMVS